MVTALFDLARREVGRPRDTSQYLALAQPTLSVQAPMVVFADPDLCGALGDLRDRHAGPAPTWMVPLAFEDLPAARSLASISRHLEAGRRNATVAAPNKDTARYVVLTWSKLTLLERAASLVDDLPEVVAWMDLGLSHLLSVPPGPLLGEMVAGAPDAFCATQLGPFDVAEDSRVDDYWQHRARPTVAAGFFSLGTSLLADWIAEHEEDARRCLRAGWPTLEEALLGTVAARRPHQTSLVSGSHEDVIANYPECVGASEWTVARRRLRQIEAQPRSNRRAQAARALLSEPMLPVDVEAPARGLELGELPVLADLAPSARVGTITVPAPAGWACTNPSVLADGDGFIGNVRLVNYRLLAGGRYGLPEGDPVVRSTNVLVGFDSSLAIRWSVDVDPRRSPLLAGHGSVRGFEDLRLFRHRGVLRALAVVAEATPDARPTIALLTFDDAGSVVDSVLLERPVPGRTEKNWVPVIAPNAEGVRGGGRDVARVIYGHHPTVVLDIDVANGAVQPASRRFTSPLHRFLRGGSQVVADREGWLTVVHERLTWAPRGTWYQHRLLRLDSSLVPVGTSAPFRFVGADVEFCCGLAVTRGQAVLTVGVQDAQAAVLVVDLDELRALVR